MKKNISQADKVVRVLFAVAVAILYLTGAIAGTLAFVLGVVAVVLFATSIVGTCPLYLLFGISTKKTAPNA